MKTKNCKYCKKEFHEIDFPAQFSRMVTCGSTDCMRLRRLESIGSFKAKLNSDREQHNLV